MTTHTHRKLLSYLLALLAALVLPGRVDADALPQVTLGGRSFPGEFPSGVVYSCSFRLRFDNFAAGQQASVEFRVVPPSSAKQGGDTILDEAFFLNGHSITADYDVRRPLSERFQPGGVGGWDVELAVHVTEGQRAVFTGVGRFLVANDCLVPPKPTSTTTMTVTLPPTTSTTVGCGQACASEPPRATLAGSSAQVAGVQGSYCWNPGPGHPALCVDSIFADPSDTLTVRRGETLTLRFATTETPSELALYRHDRAGLYEPLLAGDEVPLIPANPSSFRADFPEGTSWLVVSSRWTQGSSIWFFKVLVRSDATAQPVAAKSVPLALTG